MTFPLQDEPNRFHRSNWLYRYMGVQANLDKRVADALRSAATDAADRIRKIDDGNRSDSVLRVQYNLALRAIRRITHELFGEIGGIIREERISAAIAAVEAGEFDDKQILKALFPDKGAREAYIESLKQTARRDIEATITRILMTELPLSRRVYKTESLANGSVSRLVNNHLARGDSADVIAESVSEHISPDTPGGIGYAAKRLGRTELNNAFHAQCIKQNQEKPWVTSIRWMLSKSHKNYPGDPCEDYARMRDFPKDQVPRKPHPNCYCYVIPILEPYEIFEQNLLIGMYDQQRAISE